MNVPENAEVWLDDVRTTSKGPVREFQSPAITPGERYTYEIRARWNDNGHQLTQTQKVNVTAGGHANVTFPNSSGTADLKAVGG